MPRNCAQLVLLCASLAVAHAATDKPNGVLKVRTWLYCPNPCLNRAQDIASQETFSMLNEAGMFSFNVTGDSLDLKASPEGTTMRAMTDVFDMSTSTDPYTAILATWGSDETVTTFANAGHINVLTQLQPFRTETNPATKRPYYVRLGVDSLSTAALFINTLKVFGWKKFLFILDTSTPEYEMTPAAWQGLTAKDPSGPQFELIRLRTDAIPVAIEDIRKTGVTVMWMKMSGWANEQWLCAMGEAGMIAPTYLIGFFVTPKTVPPLMSGKVCSWEMVRRVMVGGIYTGLSPWGDPAQVTALGLPIGAVRGRLMQSITTTNAVKTAEPGWRGGPYACPFSMEGYLFDAIMALALAAHEIVQTSPDFLKNFKYDVSSASLLQKALVNQSFVGATGRVRFMPDGTRISYMHLKKLSEDGSWSTQGSVSTEYPVTDLEFKLAEPWRWCDVKISCGTLTPAMLSHNMSDLKEQGNVPFGFVQECDSGYFRGPFACEPCPNGTYAPSKGLQSACLLCQAGFRCLEGSSKQVPCESGTNSSSGASECSPCPQGTAQFLPASEKCLQCQPGFVQPQAGQKSCLACRLGEFQNVSGTTICKSCPATFTTSNEGSTEPQQCGCGPGTYYVNETQTCASCSEGVVCSSFNMPPLVDRGYYMPPNAKRDVAKLNVYKCMSEVACPGQKTMHASVCGEKFAVDSVNCGLCEDGYYLSGGSCAECGANSAVMPIAMLAFYLFAGCLHWLWNLKATAAVEAGESVLASITFGLTLAFVQSLGIFNRLQLMWPNEFKDLLGILSLFLFDMEFLRPACLIDATLASAYVMRLCVPLLMGLVFVSWLPLSIVLHKVSGGRFPRFHCDGILCSIGMIAQALYISLVASTMSLLECYGSPNDERTIRAYPYAVCGSSEYNAMIPFLVLGVLAYVIGIFAIFAHLALVAPQRYISPNFRVRVRFLVFKFRSNVWWYGLLLMVRSLGLAMVSVVLPDDPYHQFLAVATILILGLCAHLLITPYLDSYANNLETVELCTLIAIMVIGSWFMTPRDLESSEAVTLSVILIALSVFTFVVLMVVFCWAVFLAAFPRKALAMHEKEVNSVLPMLSDTCTILAGTEENTLKHILQHASYIDRWHVYEMVHFVQLELCGLQSPKFIYKRLPKVADSVSVSQGQDTIRRLSQQSIEKITRSASLASLDGDEPTPPTVDITI